jgi:hypothetical protein
MSSPFTMLRASDQATIAPPAPSEMMTGASLPVGDDRLRKRVGEQSIRTGFARGPLADPAGVR